ncbi:hypothetical protein DV736_g1535, partial [Chaetothyriales sp. CBS 134916]
MSSLSTYVVTFNCGRELIKPAVFATHLFDVASSPPDLLVLCLQEVAPIGYAFLGGSLLWPYFNAFRDAVKLAGEGYVNVVADNVGLTAIMVFAKAEVASNVRSLQTASVGVGVAEMGNKGAVGVRLGYDVGDDLMLITFVSAHLAPFEGDVARRNEDYKHIVQRLVFVDHSETPSRDQEEDRPLLQDSIPDQTAAGLYLPSSHLVFAGDLNYRTSLLPPSAEDRKSYPQPAQDESDPTHFSHLLLDDQLTLELKLNKTLHHLVEEPINFAPTYKLQPHQDVTLDSDQPWNWAPHRWPSWCDRILRSPTKIKALAYHSLPLFGTSDHRPVALFMSIPLKPVRNAYLDFTPPYEIDPAWKARREAARTKEIAFGTMAYLTRTYQGNAMLLAAAVACASVWLISRSLLLA